MEAGKTVMDKMGIRETRIECYNGLLPFAICHSLPL